MKKHFSILLTLPLLIISFGAVCLTGCGKTDEDCLVVLNYGKYIEPSLLTKFTEETGIKIKYDEYETVEDMYAKYTSGSIKYDLICTSDYMVDTLRKENQLIPIDYKCIENWDNINQDVVEQSGVFDPTHEYTLPAFYGTLGILYNTTMVSDEEVSTWNVLWDSKYKNRSIMINSQRDAFAAGLLYNGFDINSTDKSELDTALDSLCKQKDLCYAYLLDETNEAMIAGDAAMAVCYSGEAATAMEYNEDLAYIVPDEGSNLWIDAWFVPRTCKHYDEAMTFLNFLCRPDNAVENFYYVWYASPCLSVWEDAEPEDLEDVTVFPDEEILSRCKV